MYEATRQQEQTAATSADASTKVVWDFFMDGNFDVWKRIVSESSSGGAGHGNG